MAKISVYIRCIALSIRYLKYLQINEIIEMSVGKALDSKHEMVEVV